MRSVPWLTQVDFAIDVYAQTPLQKHHLLTAIIDNLNQQPYLRLYAMPLRLLPFSPSPEEAASLVAPGRSPLFYRVMVPIERGDLQFREYPTLTVQASLKTRKRGAYCLDQESQEPVAVN